MNKWLGWWVGVAAAMSPVRSAPVDTSLFSLSSPYHTVRTHLYYLQPESYAPELAARTFPTVDLRQGVKAAVQLKQILDARGLYVDLSTIPDDPDYRDSATGRHLYVLFKELPSVYVVREGKYWRYSRQTMEALPALLRETFPWGTHRLVERFSVYGGGRVIMGLWLWQWVGLGVLVGALALLYVILRWTVIRLLRQRVIRYFSVQVAQAYLRPLAGVFIWLVILYLWELLFPVLQLPVGVTNAMLKVLAVIYPVVWTVLAYRLVQMMMARVWEVVRQSRSVMDDQLMPLFDKLVRGVVILVGLFFVLKALGVDVLTLLAGISIGGIAVALAAQETLQHVIGTVIIFLDRPFRIGETISTPDFEGVVERVGFRSTQIRKFDNSVIYVPNGTLINSLISNWERRRYRRWKATFGLTYDTPPDKVALFVEGLKGIIERHPDLRKDFYLVRFVEMADYSLNVMMVVYVLGGNDWVREMRVRHEVLMAVLRMAEAIGVSFAFPTQTVELHTVESPSGQETADPESRLKSFLERLRWGESPTNPS